MNQRRIEPITPDAERIPEDRLTLPGVDRILEAQQNAARLSMTLGSIHQFLLRALQREHVLEKKLENKQKELRTAKRRIRYLEERLSNYE